MTVTGRFQVQNRAAEISRWLCLALFWAVLMWLIPRHEPWSDEAQAWLIGRYLTLGQIFGTYIHYEGSPGLWHAFMWALSRLHVSYAGMHWVSGLIALGTASLLVFQSPFPLVLQICLPFTYFFIYQYAVVARSYVLLAFILFVLASLWKARWRRPSGTALLIGLLANTAVHGFAIAAGLIFALCVEWFQGSARPPISARQLIAPIVSVALCFGAAAWSIYPAPDAGWMYTAHRLQQQDTSGDRLAKVSESHPVVALLPGSVRWVSVKVVDMLQALRHPLWDEYQVGLIAWGILFCLWLLLRKVQYAAPVLLLAYVSRPMKYHMYHAGLMWLLFIFLCWVTWNQSPGKDRAGMLARWGQGSLAVCLGVCVAVQLVWAWQAVRFDTAHPYSPNRDGAAILREYLNEGQRVDVAVPAKTGREELLGEYFVTGMEPYFDRQPISNMPFRFWFWGANPSLRAGYVQDIEHKSAVIVFEEDPEDSRYFDEEAKLETLGYSRHEVVCGQMYYPDFMSIPICHAFYRPPQINK